MRTITIPLVVSLLVLAAVAVSSAQNQGRIYGEITTVDDDVFEGLIRWDKNEACWVDVLDGSKDLPKRRYKDRDRGRRKQRDRETAIKIFGIEIGGRNTFSWSGIGQAQSGIRFGHIRSMEVIDDDAVLLTLKSGEEVELEGGSTDIGTGIREIVVEDAAEGEIELDWDDIEEIKFMSARDAAPSSFGERLYGTLTTRRGNEFTGYVCWDIDELFTDDILDGNEDGRKRKVKFGKIASIERYSSRGALVELLNGDEMVLRGTNDVDDDNRGIVISDPAFGQVIVEWDEFDRLDFTDQPRQIEYDDFDGGRRIYGTVYTEDGDQYTGEIRWDDDEEYTWEILDGKHQGIEFDIEFGLIKSIEKRSYRYSTVTVSDGRSFKLRGSNDVDEDNKGVYVLTSDGDEIEVDWEDFERLELTQR